jgi:hypothetical protein
VTDHLFGCGGCIYRWYGYLTCHCSACHRTFTGIHSFDKHRMNGKCVHPEHVLDKHGQRMLALTNRRYPCWGAAGEKPNFWKEDDEEHSPT